MLALIFASIATAAPATGLKLALPEVRVVRIDAETQAFYGEHLAQAMKLMRPGDAGVLLKSREPGLPERERSVQRLAVRRLLLPALGERTA